MLPSRCCRPSCLAAEYRPELSSRNDCPPDPLAWSQAREQIKIQRPGGISWNAQFMQGRMSESGQKRLFTLGPGCPECLQLSDTGPIFEVRTADWLRNLLKVTSLLSFDHF
jgi:hypothetical protein